MKKLCDFDHPYYCSDSNYYSNEAATSYETFSDFYEDWHDVDIDMNLIFRFDVKKREESERCYAEIFIIHQRKGIFKPIHIALFDDKDEPLARALLLKHWNRLKEIWTPISEEAPQGIKEVLTTYNQQRKARKPRKRRCRA